MKDNNSYVHILKTGRVVLGVFVEEEAALASEANFALLYHKMFPTGNVPKVHLERHVVIGGVK